MINDIINQLKKIIFFLETFDAAWKENTMKEIFPVQAKDKIEEIESKLKEIKNYTNIIETFANWKSIGVWNASDLLTFLLTSRITIIVADSIEKSDKKMVKEEIEYLLYFINYLLSTNIHPPSETHKDHIPFYANDVSYSRTYKDAQNMMRLNLAKFFATKI